MTSPSLPSSPASLDLEARLRERIKELEFLHHAARLLNMRGEPRDILPAVLELLPGALQYPHLATARIVCADLDLQTEGHQLTLLCLRAEFDVPAGSQPRGFVEVCYASAPAASREAFLPEERSLLDSCAELLRAYFERVGAKAIGSKLLEAEATERAARATERAKDEFFGNVAHELRSSLHVMRGWIQMLRQAPSEPGVQSRGLSILERNVLLQAKLIDDLLDLSRITLGKLELDARWLDLPELVVYAVDATRPSARAKSIELTSELEQVGSVCGDQQRLQQVIYNVLGNAVKFTPGGGSIEVKLRKLGSHAELSVKDSGLGIEQDILPHVFDRFRQGTLPGRRAGLGLGLAIAQYLVECHHGTITAASEGPGRGATFRILLPLGGAVAGRECPS